MDNLSFANKKEPRRLSWLYFDGVAGGMKEYVLIQPTDVVCQGGFFMPHCLLSDCRLDSPFAGRIPEGVLSGTV